MTFRNKALAISLFAAAVWHLFWISAIKVVIVPEDIKEVRFPKISFLGQVVGGRAISLRTEARERSFLEKRFLGYSDKLLPKFRAGEDGYFVKDAYQLAEDTSPGRISGSLARPKGSPPSIYPEG